MSILELFNSAGRLQFSVDQPPLCLQQKIIVPIDSGGTLIRVGGNAGISATSRYVKEVDVGTGAGVMATYSATAHHISYRSGSIVGLAYAAQSAGATVEIYVFRRGAFPGDVLERRDAGNNVIFSDRTQPLKVRDQRRYAEDLGASQFLDESGYTGTAGQKIACVHNNIATIMVRESDPTGNGTRLTINRQMTRNSQPHLVGFSRNRQSVLRLADGDLGTQVGSYGSATFVDITNY